MTNSTPSRTTEQNSNNTNREKITVIEIDQFTQTGDIGEFSFDELRQLIEKNDPPQIDNIKANARKLFNGRFSVKTVSADDKPTPGYVWFTENKNGNVIEYKKNFATF